MNGRLYLKTVFDGEKTVTDDLMFTPPFKLYSPFYEKQSAKYISMTAAAGMLSGDVTQTVLEIGERCDVIFTDQGYKKLFSTADGQSFSSTEIEVKSSGSLYYIPHPVMTFSGCSHSCENKISIDENSRLVFSEIYCCGRTAMGEKFGLKRFRSRTEIKIGGKIDFIDNVLTEPKSFPITSVGFFEEFTHSGVMYIYDKGRTKRESAENKLTENAAVSTTQKGLVIRALGTSGDEIYQSFRRIAESIKNESISIL